MLSRDPLSSFQNGSLSLGHPGLLLSPCTLVRTQKLSCSRLVGKAWGTQGRFHAAGLGQLGSV